MQKTDFTLTDKATGLTLKDALHLTDAEVAELGEDGIEAMKATRLANYVAVVTAPPVEPEEQAKIDEAAAAEAVFADLEAAAPVEAVSDELEAAKAEVAELEAALDEAIAKVAAEIKGLRTTLAELEAQLADLEKGG